MSHINNDVWGPKVVRFLYDHGKATVSGLAEQVGVPVDDIQSFCLDAEYYGFMIFLKRSVKELSIVTMNEDHRAQHWVMERVEIERARS